MDKKYGIYAGSFNPFHKGHMDILKKANKLFDEVIVAVGKNPEKSTHNDIDIVENIMSIVSNQVVIIPDMLIDFLVSFNANVTLIRGLRNGFDFSYEQTQLRFLEDMVPKGFDFKVIYIPCDVKYEHVSSSAIRYIDSINPEYAKKYIEFEKK